MTNIWGDPKKRPLRDCLFQAAERSLEELGWKVEPIPRSGKSSVRQITKGKTVKRITIRTSQDTWIAFPRNANDDGWATLGDVDYVVAATVDNPKTPRYVQIHLLEGEEMRARFDRAYSARKKASYHMPLGRGIWISLYDNESDKPVTLVGAGAGLAHPPIKREPLIRDNSKGPEAQTNHEAALTISEAKRLLALSLGIDEGDITITIST
jgi:hypothetical protein